MGVDRLGIDLRVHCGDFCDEYRVGFRTKATNAEDVKSEMLKLFQEAWERDQGQFCCMVLLLCVVTECARCGFISRH